MQFLPSLAIFAAANLVWLAITGVHLGGDTGLFLDGARRLLDGQPLVDREPSYVGYVAVVAASQALGSGLIGVVLFQIAVATLGAGAVYRLGMELGGARVATIATGLLTIDFDVNRWHTYVLADSLFLSAFVLCVWLVHHAAERRTWSGYVVALVVLIATSLIRPEGWFALPAAGFYWVARGLNGRAARLIGSAGVIGACLVTSLVVAPRLGGNVSAVNPAGMLQRGQTIWAFDGWRLAMPQPDESVPSTQAPGPISYAMRHPIATLELMLARIGVHLAHVRPFYSLAHNTVIVLWLLPVYALSMFAIWASWNRPLTRWCALAFGSQALVVALTHADWDGRYLAHVMPIVYPFVALGFWTIVSRRPAIVGAA
jgi:hypothetical protein